MCRPICLAAGATPGTGRPFSRFTAARSPPTKRGGNGWPEGAARYLHADDWDRMLHVGLVPVRSVDDRCRRA